MSQPEIVLSFAVAFSTAIAALIARLTSVGGRAARAVALAAATAMLGASAFAIVGSGLRVNFTASMPLGIYRLEPLPATGVARGMLVAVCAPNDAADLGRRRGYLSTGPCPQDTEPLLKTVAGVPGDDVAVSADGVAVNGCPLTDSRPIASDRAGRQISAWPRGDYHLGRGQIWLYAGNPRSWDSRYWGPAATADLLALAVPLPERRASLLCASEWRGRRAPPGALLGASTLVPKKWMYMRTAARAHVTKVLEDVHDRVYHTEDAALVKELAQALGRPTLARLTNTPDLKTITRWSLGRNRPSPDRLDRVRHAAMAYYALIDFGLTPTNAEQWFRGANPVLDFAMPIDALREGRYADVLIAVRNHADIHGSTPHRPTPRKSSTHVPRTSFGES